MKITKSQLKQIIKEEIAVLIETEELEEAVVYGGTGKPDPQASRRGPGREQFQVPDPSVRRQYTSAAATAAAIMKQLGAITRTNGERRKTALAAIENLRTKEPAAAEALDSLIFQRDQAFLKEFGEGFFGPNQERWEKTT